MRFFSEVHARQANGILRNCASRTELELFNKSSDRDF